MRVTGGGGRRPADGLKNEASLHAYSTSLHLTSIKVMLRAFNSENTVQYRGGVRKLRVIGRAVRHFSAKEDRWVRLPHCSRKTGSPGGIGRRASLKMRYQKWYVGSNPTMSTV